MGRHRVQKRINIDTAIQRLFDNNIDFDNNVVPDSINGYGASLKYSYIFKWGQKFRINTNVTLQVSNDLSVLFRANVDMSMSFKIYKNLIVVLENYRFYITVAGTSYVATMPVENRFLWNYFLITKSGSNYNLYLNDVLILNFTNATILTTVAGTIDPSSYTLQYSYFKDFVVYNTVIDYTLFNISNIDAIPTGIIPIFRYNFASNSIDNLLVNIVNGTSSSIREYNGSSVYLLTTLFGSYNLKYGFDLYTLDSNPTTKLYVPLKYDGTSFNKVISGYTFVTTYAQTGNEFLPCETKFKQPIEASLIAKDTANFYYTAGVPKEISFDNLLTAPSYVNFDLINGKITNLTI